jgi:hypothetical protein
MQHFLASPIFVFSTMPVPVTDDGKQAFELLPNVNDRNAVTGSLLYNVVDCGNHRLDYITGEWSPANAVKSSWISMTSLAFLGFWH